MTRSRGVSLRMYDGVTDNTLYYGMSGVRPEMPRAVVDGIEIGDDFFIGRGTTLRAGCCMGGCVLVGAGAVGCEVIPDDCVVIGNFHQVVGDTQRDVARKLEAQGREDLSVFEKIRWARVEA